MNHDEDKQQAAVFQWAKFYPELNWMHASLNGAKLSGTSTQRKIRGGRLKAQGMKKGVFDICLPKARNGYHGMFIEMKRGDGKGKVSVEQKDFGLSVTADGYLCVVCHGSAQAIEEIKNYMGYK